MRKGTTDMAGPSDVGPQNPTIDRQGTTDTKPGTAYEVFSFDKDGKRRRHQLWRDRAKAYEQMKELKKIYGLDIKVGVREVRDVKGNLFQQSVRAQGSSSKVSKAKKSKFKIKKDGHPRVDVAESQSRPPIAEEPDFAQKGIVTGAGRVMTGKSPKVSGKVGRYLLGRTSSGKEIHNDPEHESHRQFSAQDHMDAYRAHAKQLTHLDPSVTHPSIITHHKNALNAHYRMGVSMHKGFRTFDQVVSACEERLAKADGWASMCIGKTSRGKEIYGSASHPDHAGFNADDHRQAARMQENLARNAERAAANAKLNKRGKDAALYDRKWKFHDKQAKSHRAASEKVGGRKKEHSFDRVNEITGKDRVHIRPTN